MQNPLRALLLLLLCLLPAALFGQQPEPAVPPADLDPKVAAELIGGMIEERSGQIEIALIIAGTRREDKVFEAAQARRVVAIHPVNADGRRRRQVCKYDFFWSPDYGWFHWRTGEQRGGEVVEVWSETRGAIVIK